MSIEAMKLALEALEDLFVKNKVDVGAINALRQAIAEAEKQDNAYIYASNLAKTIWQKHYMKESPKFALLDTIEGVLTQIDNMTCGLVREKPAQPEQEPVAWMDEYGDVLSASVVDGNGLRNIPLYTTPQKRTWVGLTEEDRNDCLVSADPCECLAKPESHQLMEDVEAKLREKNGG